MYRVTTNMLTLSAMAVLLATSGCTSLNTDVLNSFVPNNQARPSAAKATTPAVVNPVASRAHQIRDAVDGGLKPYFQYVDQYPGETFEQITVSQDGKTTSVLFTTNTGKGFFPAGKYDLMNVSRSENRIGVAFIALTAEAIDDILRNVDQLGGSKLVSIMVNYTAQADGLPIRGLRYAGEYGDVSLSADETTVNGVPTGIKVKAGQLITNEQLAALRAVSMRAFLAGKLKGHSMLEKFNLTTTKATGQLNRWVSVELRITPAN